MAAGWLAGVVALVAVFGCAGPGRSTRAVHEDPDRSVRLETRQGSGADSSAMRFAHPVLLKEEDWDRILTAISIQTRKRLLPSIGAGQGGPRAAFEENERRYLVRYLHEAFSMAQPDEWVVFFLSHPRDQRGDLRGGPGVTEVTSGGLFVEDGRLHVVLANYRYAVTIPSLAVQILENPLRPAGEAFYELVPDGNQTLKTEPSWDLTRPFQAHAPELIVEYRSLLVRPDKPVVPHEVTGARDRPSLEERLRTLQRLREQGLIAEEEYQAKRQQLLDEL